MFRDVDWSEWKCAVASHWLVLNSKPQIVPSVVDGLLTEISHCTGAFNCKKQFK